MATKKKIGFDPLAWMKEDADAGVSDMSQVKTAAKAAPSRRKTAAKPASGGLNVELLESSFNALAPHADELVARFYEELFRRYPGVVPLFKNTNPVEQRKKLVAALQLVINNLRKPKVLENALRNLGAKHQAYGAQAEHYGAVATTLLDVMGEMAGDLWTDEVATAWNDALNEIAKIMIGAYEAQEEPAMAATKGAVKGGIQSRESEELTRLRSAVDGAMTAIMMIDRDFNITYANASTVKLLREHEREIRSLFPAFNVDRLVGSNIDMFHANPGHQRNLLSNPKNLPYATDIHVGSLTFQINVTAQISDDGSYIGNTMEWSDVTELRKRESEVTRLQGTVDGAMTAIMMVDRDFNITYANTSTLTMLRKHEATLRGVFPGFAVDKLVGSNIDMFHKNPAHQRQLLSSADNLPYSTDIKVGPLRFSLNVTAITDAKGAYVGNALEWSDVTDLRAKEEEVARLKSAVDGAASNLMLCDENLNITYANPAVVNMLARRQNELRKIWPSLDAYKLTGQCIDQFHKNPAHQRALLSDPSRLPAKAEIKVGELEFEVHATMITGPNGEYMGNMVQWQDITEQKDAERQIQNLINGAIAGELDSRIDVTSYVGFIRGLGEGVNSLMDSVVRPIQEGTRVMQRLADGDLTQMMEGEFEGEFKVMCDAVNSSIGNLRNMVEDILESSGNINSAASEIAQGNADLSQRTEEQASSLEETASSMEELTSTVKQNADNARQANQLAAGARTEAEKGGEVAAKTTTAMSEINSSSKKIADIIGVIDEIAFQTNLLALNAAVEAARAGEQGRGFAVVAAEVRNLAQRSAAAAKEIKALIKDSVEKVDEGTRLVNESGKSLEEIVSSVKKVSDIIAEIAAASQEQSAGIEQVNKAVMQMDEMTQQNAALVEEAAAASESLDEQAGGLIKLISFFKTGDDVSYESNTPKRSGMRVAASNPAVKSRTPARSAPPRQAQRPVRSEKVSRSVPRKEDDGSEWEEF